MPIAREGLSLFRGQSTRSAFVIVFGARTLGSVLQAISLLIVARMAPVSEFGALSILFSSCAILYTAADLGLSGYVPKMRSLGRSDYLSTALLINQASTLVAGLLGVFASLLFLSFSGSPYWLALLILGLALEKNVECSLGVSLADGRPNVSATSILIRRTGALAAVAIAISFGYSVTLAYVVGVCAASFAAQIHVRLATGRLVSKQRVRSLVVLRETAPFSVNSVAAQARMLDVTIAGALLSTSAAGQYGAATRISQPLMLLSTSLNSVMMPYASRASIQTARGVSLKLFFCSVVGAVILIVPALWSDAIVLVILGPSYAGASEALRYTLIFFPIIAVSAPIATILQAQDLERITAWVSIGTALLTVLLVVLGALAIGIAGVAIALGVAYLLKCLILLTIIDQKRRKGLLNG